MTYKHTKYATYIGYVVQALINNLPPLLFLTFRNEFGISVDKISLLIAFNFGTQIAVDIIAAKAVDKIGYRVSVIAAHVFAVAGLLSMGILPFVIDPFVGLTIAVILNGVGGGLTEVIISPIVEALPGDEKESAMSILHSFYCWGQMSVVLLSTLYFSLAGGENWRYLPIIWAALPALNGIFFAFVPIRTLNEDGESVPLRQLFGMKLFWVFCLLMLCAGASELSMSQWSSFFAEAGLGVSKTVGDLLGPCAFAVLMGTARVFYGIYSSKINLYTALRISSILCIVSYLVTVFSPSPIISLIGCAVCGLSVGVMWPGTFSLAAKRCPQGGTAMFAILALAGDMGCGGGPGVVGIASDVADKLSLNWLPALSGEGGEYLKYGLLSAAVFPLIMLVGVSIMRRKSRKSA